MDAAIPFLFLFTLACGLVGSRCLTWLEQRHAARLAQREAAEQYDVLLALAEAQARELYDGQCLSCDAVHGCCCARPPPA